MATHPESVSAPERNLELKVRRDAAALAAVRERLTAIGTPLATWRQVDTYFAVAHGRLKLREMASMAGEVAAELIAYARSDWAGPRWSAYRRVPVGVGEAAAIKAALAETVGVLGVVAKVRAVGRHRRTRVHLDVVDGLGSFVELETVVAGGSEAGAEVELAEMAEMLGLDGAGAEVIAGSYLDLLLAVTASDASGRGGGR